jgi:transposase
MTQKRSYKQYPKEFKDEAVAFVFEQGYSMTEAAKSLGIAASILYKWKGSNTLQVKMLAEDEQRTKTSVQRNEGATDEKTDFLI